MPARTKIEQIMTKSLFSVTLEDTVKTADEIMRAENIHHVPVVEDGKLIGMITDRKIVEYTLRRLYDFHDTSFGKDGLNKIGDFQNIMAPVEKWIFPEDSVLKAVELMTKKRLDALPVVDWDHNLIGLVTIHDVLLFIRTKLID